MKKSYYLPILLLLMSSMVLTASTQEQVSQTVYVYEGDFNGTLLSDIQVTGQDAAGSSFEGITDSNGSIVINGQPGTWQFTFMKEGYNPLSLDYDVIQTGEGAVYLQRTAQLQENATLPQTMPPQTYQQPSPQSLPEQMYSGQNRSSAEAWYLRGVVLDEQGKHEEAAEAYDEVLKIDPQCAMAWYNKAVALQRIGRENESEEAFANAKELGYNDSI
jgi:tetratricopeptide (TPR) repeat protein